MTGSEAVLRHIFVGDIHGCYDELVNLLDELRPSKGDILVSVGDMVDRGPGVLECLSLWRDRGYSVVRGNHEDRYLRWVQGERVPTTDGFDSTLSALDRDPTLLEYITDWPLCIDFPEIGVATVHAGVVPTWAFSLRRACEHQWECLRLRYLRKEAGAWKPLHLDKQHPGDPFWTDVWSGDRCVVYGHTPSTDGQPSVRPNSIGIDTGCVYGRCLTAAVHESGEWSFIAVPALRKYFAPAPVGSRREI